MGNSQATTTGKVLATGLVQAKGLVPAQVVTVTKDTLDHFNAKTASRRSRKDLKTTNGDRDFTCACFSKGKTLFVGADADGFIYVYRCEGAEILQVHRAHDNAITVLHWCRRSENSPERLVTGCRDGTVKVWDLGSQEAGGNGHLVHGTGRSFSAEPKVGVVPGGSPRSSGSKRRNSAPRIPPAAVCSVLYNSVLGRLYVGFANGALRLFDTNSATVESSLETAHRAEINQLAIAAVDPDSTPRLDRHVLDTVMRLDSVEKRSSSFGGAADGDGEVYGGGDSSTPIADPNAGLVLIASSADGRVKGWNIGLFGKVALFDYEMDVQVLLCDSSHPDVLFGGTASGSVLVWQVSRAGLTTLKRIRLDQGCVSAMDYSFQLDCLALATAKGYVRVVEDTVDNVLLKTSTSKSSSVRNTGQSSIAPISQKFLSSNHRERSGSIGDEAVDDVIEALVKATSTALEGQSNTQSRSIFSSTKESSAAVSESVFGGMSAVAGESTDASPPKKPTEGCTMPTVVTKENDSKDARQLAGGKSFTDSKTDEEWLAISQLYEVAKKLSHSERSLDVIQGSQEKMRQWFYSKTEEVDQTLKKKREALVVSHRSLIDARVRKERWTARRQSMIADLEARHALEKKQLLERLDEEAGALENVVPEGRRMMAQVALKLSSQHMEARAFCKAEAAHLAQKTLTVIARREGQGLPEGEETPPPGIKQALGLGDLFEQNTEVCIRPGARIKDRFLVFNHRVDDEMTTSFDALDLLKKQRVIVQRLPPDIPLRTDLRHPALRPLFDVYATDEYTCVVKRWVDCSLSEFVQKESGETNQNLSKNDVATMMYRLLEALLYIHSKGLVHRQVRPGTIYLVQPSTKTQEENKSAPPRSYLEHFGFMPSLEGTEVAEAGVSFSAPETFSYSAVKGSDVWSLGCVLAWLLQTPVERASAPLFKGASAKEVLISIADRLGCPQKSEMENIAQKSDIPVSGRHFLTDLPAKFAELHPGSSVDGKGIGPCISALSEMQDAQDLLTKMLVWDPFERLSPTQAMQHKFFEEVRAHLLQTKQVAVV